MRCRNSTMNCSSNNNFSLHVYGYQKFGNKQVCKSKISTIKGLTKLTFGAYGWSHSRQQRALSKHWLCYFLTAEIWLLDQFISYQIFMLLSPMDMPPHFVFETNLTCMDGYNYQTEIWWGLFSLKGYLSRVPLQHLIMFIKYKNIFSSFCLFSPSMSMLYSSLKIISQREPAPLMLDQEVDFSQQLWLTW